MPDIKWIKITTEMFDDEKIRIIEGMPEADTLIIIWVRLICMAGKVNAGGHVYIAPELPYKVEELASVFNRPLNTVKLALNTFHRLQMIELTDDGSIFITNFEKHQNIEGMERVREGSRKRVAAFRVREKRKLLETSEPVTLHGRYVTQQIRIDKNREEEKRMWDNVLLKIKTSVSLPNYETWFKETTCMEITENEVIIGVQREEQAAYIETSVRGLVEKFIAEEIGNPLGMRLVLIE